MNDEPIGFCANARCNPKGATRVRLEPSGLVPEHDIAREMVRKLPEAEQYRLLDHRCPGSSFPPASIEKRSRTHRSASTTVADPVEDDSDV